MLLAAQGNGVRETGSALFVQKCDAFNLHQDLFPFAFQQKIDAAFSVGEFRACLKTGKLADAVETKRFFHYPVGAQRIDVHPVVANLNPFQRELVLAPGIVAAGEEHRIAGDGALGHGTGVGRMGGHDAFVFELDIDQKTLAALH